MIVNKGVFDKRLKNLRSEAKINQTDLARALGVTQGTIGNWETGKRIPDAETLKEVANYFNVSVDYLIGNDTKEESQAYFDDPKIKMLARNLSQISDEDRKTVIDAIEGTIRAYKKAKGV